MGKHSKQATIRTYTRTVKGKAQTVRSHSRKTTWSDARKSAVAAGASGAVFASTAVEFGFKVATLILVILLSILSVIFIEDKKRKGRGKGSRGGGGSSLWKPRGTGGRRRRTKKGFGVFNCKSCNKNFSNPFRHVCTVKWSQMTKGKRR